MRKMGKKALCTSIIAGMVLVNTMTAFAGTWKTGAGENQNKWWYDFDNGSYASNGWQWIDGNNDGVAECYYFDASGWMLSGTTTPDGYTVNADGAWTENGVVKTQAVQAQAQPEQSQSNVAAAGKYSGVYHQVSEWPLEYLGFDDSWANVTLATEEANGVVTKIVINGITVTELTASENGIEFNLPGTECAVTLAGDSLKIYHLATADFVDYKKN